jgi:hypothetical protein
MNSDNRRPPAPEVYRLHVNTSCDDREATLRFCLDGGFLGMGWPVRDNGTGELTWEHYERVAGDWYDDGVNPSVRALYELPDGALVWMRDTRGVYYLGRVSGPWRYLASEQADQFDIHNVRPARIIACGVEAVVPGTVANAFIGGRTLRRTPTSPCGATAGRFSRASPASALRGVRRSPRRWRVASAPRTSKT